MQVGDLVVFNESTYNPPIDLKEKVRSIVMILMRLPLKGSKHTIAMVYDGTSVFPTHMSYLKPAED